VREGAGCDSRGGRVSKNDYYGNVEKDFNPLEYYRSHGKKTKQVKKIRKFDEFIPKYFEPEDTKNIERKRNPELDQIIKSLVSELQTKSYVEVKDVLDAQKYIDRISDAARRRGLRLRFSVSSDGNVFVRMAKK
jgi:hypothetical protein